MDDLKYRLQQLQIGQVGGSYGTNVPDIPVGVHKGIGESKPTRQVPEFGEQRASAPERQPSVPAATAAYPSQMQALSTEAGVGEIGLQVSRDVVTLSIPTKHTTAAHKLLRWSSIQRLMSPNPTFSIESYIMDLEEGRCLLDLYGQGGKSGPRDSWQPHLASPAPSTTSVNSEVQTFSPTTPLEDSWGKRFDRLNGENMKRMPHVAFGGLGPDGTLQIDRQTCDDLLKSYTENIHILHPFLNMGQLKNTKDELARRYNATEYQGTLSHHHKPAAPPTKAIKRKHSTSTTSGPPTKSSCGCSSSSNSMFRPSLERSVSTALVLLVLALGKICQWKDPLPGSAPDRTQTSHQRTQRSPTLNQSSNYWNMASTPDVSFRLGHIGRVSSNEGLSSFEKGSKNLDAIPGLAYYAYATNILGNLHGSIDLTYVQANLLAGLYAGQLAHVIESWSWISTACRDLQVLLRPCVLLLS